jgi:hypothetical protein
LINGVFSPTNWLSIIVGGSVGRGVGYGVNVTVGVSLGQRVFVEVVSGVQVGGRSAKAVGLLVDSIIAIGDEFLLSATMLEQAAAKRTENDIAENPRIWDIMVLGYL